MICQRCGSSHALALPDSSAAWGVFCIFCLEKSKLCDGCNKIHPANDVIIVGNQILCQTCAGDAKRCDKCGALHVGGLVHRKKNYCDSCAKDFTTCSSCGKLHLRINITDLDKMQYQITNDVCNICLTKIKLTTVPIEVYRCGVCGEYHAHKTNFIDTPCEKHAHKFITCICCGKVRHKIYGRNNSDSNVGVCEDCCPLEGKKWEYCRVCSDYVLAEDLGSNRLCKRCAEIHFECPLCNRLQRKDKSCIVDGEVICGSCKQNCSCQKCGTLTLHSEAGYCYSCCDKHQIIKINNYSFKPRFKMFGNGIHLGVENEIANVTEEDKKLLASVPRSWMFMKSDSSVQYGVECVFHPTTLSYFQENKAIIEKHFQNKNLKRHSSAGMHVHLSKDKFGTYQLFKFIQFFKDHTAFIEKVAERKANGYAHHIDKKPTEIAMDAKKNNSDHERYRTININNKYTIEVRIFAGVVDAKSFMKNIEFCDALYNFTKVSPHFKKGKISLSYFVAYVDKYRHLYPNLNEFLGGTSPKEIPEKYRKEEEIPTEVVQSIVQEVQENVAELRVGSRVRFTDNSHNWYVGNSNPLQSAGYDVIGTVAYRMSSDDRCQWHVQWDTGTSNGYASSDLTVVG